ncbi:MAG: MaoC family dehydratase N-terminal domain-containing protein [Nitrospirae bacterium]|nr:MaoC family dehydratase N-terminal domain-containing protein [Nitrospirota bacterium]
MVDRSLIGMEGDSVEFEVEKGAIRRFAQAIGDPNPVYTDEAAARRAGYSGLVAPPTFATTFNDTAYSLRARLPLDFKRILHGEMAFEYHQPIVAGMKLRCRAKLADAYEKPGKSGSMEFYVIEIAGHETVSGTLVFASRSTVIMRG